MLQYAALGTIQGVTEFLPVSSSAHLAIMQKVFGVTEQGIVLPVVLHLGTCLALIIFFMKDIVRALRSFKTVMLILLVTAITGALGLSGRDFFEKIFNSIELVAGALLVTGAILILTRRFINARRDILDIKDAFTLGIAQGIAIIPGISRSGITISSLLFRGVDRETGFRFSFLASIPAVLGAVVLESKNIREASGIDSLSLWVGFLFSFFFGMLSLWLLKKMVLKAKFHYFGYYCIIAAVAALLFVK